MKLMKALLPLFLLMVVFTTPVIARESSTLTSKQRIQLINRLKRQTVVVYAVNDKGNGSKGSGVAVRRFGDYVLVVTNYHVVDLAIGDRHFIQRKMLVELLSGKRKNAYLLDYKYDKERMIDLAFLIVPDPEKELLVANVVSDKSPSFRVPKKGQTVYAIGNPLGEKFFFDDGEITDYDSRVQAIMHDAVIEHGSSGGGLFDINGNLIGINTWMVNKRFGRSIEINKFLRMFVVRGLNFSADTKGWSTSHITIYKGYGARVLAIGQWGFAKKYGWVKASGVKGFDKGKRYRDFFFACLLARVEGNNEVSGISQAWSSSSGTTVKWDDATMGFVNARDVGGRIEFAINDNFVRDNSGRIAIFVLKPYISFERGNYQGDRKNGIPHGNGRMNFYADAPFIEYSGSWIDGIPRGKGRLVHRNGDVFEGTFYFSRRPGFEAPGRFYFSTIYQKGRLTFASGDVYEGEWKDGRYEGKGKMFFVGGNVYDGEWRGGLQSGQGKYTYKSGHVYTGEFKAGLRSGQGKMVYPGGEIYIGEWAGDKRQGKGKMTYKDGRVEEGVWKDSVLVK